MAQGESKDKERMARLKRLEKRIVTHSRLVGEAQDVESYARNSTAVITAQQEMIEILVSVVRDQAAAWRVLRGSMTTKGEGKPDGDAASAT